MSVHAAGPETERVATAAAPLLGRDGELAELYALVDRIEARGGALVVRGEAGIGKSALLAAARERICDAADNDSLRTHVRELFAGWQAPVAEAYARFGAPPAEAEAHATVLVAALEGALILARAQRNIEPLDTVERFFASRAPDRRRA